jgi:putative transposase
MKTSKFSDSQIVSILKQAEAGAPVPELCREHNISSATFYKWRSKFGGDGQFSHRANERAGRGKSAA